MGPLGSGRSTLATQIAHAAARAGSHTVVIAGRELLPDIAFRLERQASHWNRPSNTDRVELAELPLELVDAGFDYGRGDDASEVLALARRDARRLLVVYDDVDQWTGTDPERISTTADAAARWAYQQGASVLVTLPTRQAADPSGAEIPDGWLRAADVVLRLDPIHWRGPRFFGEACLDLVRHRHGETRRIGLATRFDQGLFGGMAGRLGEAVAVGEGGGALVSY